jgi:tRNA(Ile2) C34 agmatinyltransferase TiaS
VELPDGFDTVCVTLENDPLEVIDHEPIYRQNYIIYDKSRISPAYSIKFDFENPIELTSDYQGVLRKFIQNNEESLGGHKSVAPRCEDCPTNPKLAEHFSTHDLTFRCKKCDLSFHTKKKASYKRVIIQ